MATEIATCDLIGGKYLMITTIGKPPQDPIVNVVYTDDYWGTYREESKKFDKAINDGNEGSFSLDRVQSKDLQKIIEEGDLIEKINGKPLSKVYNLVMGLFGQLKGAKNGNRSSS